MKSQITDFFITIPLSIPGTDMQVSTDSISLISSLNSVHGSRQHRRHWRH